MAATLRWDPYFLSSRGEAEDLLKSCLDTSRKILFVLGKGFDIRMNFVLQKILEHCPEADIECMLICFNEGEDSSSLQYTSMVEKNVKEFEKLMCKRRYQKKDINLWKEDGNRKRRIGDREAASLFTSIEDIKQYTDIYVDISALPRGIYFSLVGKLLHIIDNRPVGITAINLIVAAAENAMIDASIHEDQVDSEGKFLLGFTGGIKTSPSERIESLIWMPIMGEDKSPHINVAYLELQPTEVCPIFPYPSKNPRRPDALLMDYHRLLFDELKVEPQNMMYVPEQNPFEAYKIIVKTVRNYNASLHILGGCRAALSTFSSKLLSVGTLLAAYQVNTVDDRDIIGVMNVDAKGYKIDKPEDWDKLNTDSELFLIWLTGDPYEE